MSLVETTHNSAPSASFDPEMEQALLATLLWDNRQIGAAAETLRPEHFQDQAHAEMYRTITAMAARGETVNPLTAAPYLAGVYGSEAEARRQLALLRNDFPGGRAVDYARHVVDQAVRRQMEAIALDVLQKVRTSSLDLSGFDIAEATARAVADLDLPTSQVRPMVTVREAVEQAIEAAETARRSGHGLSGVTTGLTDLDRQTGGLQAGELIVLGARPSIGKSDICWNIAINASTARANDMPGGAATAVFSLEMPSRQLGARLLARATGVPASRQRRGEVSDAEFVKFAQFVPDLLLWIDDTARATPSHIMRRARRLQQRRELGLIVVDHLAIMGAPDGYRGRSETEVVTELTREMKAVATTLNVPVLLLSQLSRQVEMREDKRPMLSDLRQSGSIEQDADAVMFLYRDQYYLERSEPARRHDESDQKFNDRVANWQARLEASKNIAEVIVAKQRNGPIGTVRLFYDAATSTFADLQDPWGDR